MPTRLNMRGKHMAWRFKNRICGRGGILAGVVLASAVIWACWWFLWPLRESGRWARTFDAVAVGTPVERVQSVFTALSPRHQSRWEVTSPRTTLLDQTCPLQDLLHAGVGEFHRMLAHRPGAGIASSPTRRPAQPSDL